MKESSSVCRGQAGNTHFCWVQDAEKALTSFLLDPGPPQALPMALLPSPRPCHDTSLGKAPERGLVQARVMGKWTWQSWEQQALALWLVCWDVKSLFHFVNPAW